MADTKTYTLYPLIMGMRSQAIQKFVSLNGGGDKENSSRFIMFRWYQQVKEAVDSFDSLLNDLNESVEKGEKTQEQVNELAEQLAQTEVEIGPVPTPISIVELEKKQATLTIQQLTLLEDLGLIHHQVNEKDDGTIEGAGKTFKDVLSAKLSELDKK